MRYFLGEYYKLNNDKGATYTILNVIGEGGSCIAYRAKVDSTGTECVIKEYYPISYAIERVTGGQLICKEKERLELGIKEFAVTIDTQVELRKKQQITNQTFYVIDRFYQNNTYYIVVPLFQGKTYSNNEKLSLYDRMRVCRSVADYVNRCHKVGYLCLDIKPDNIFVVPETPEFAMFFDFDSMCKITGVSFGKTSSYTEAWAAPEQLVPGAYESISIKTDVYILGELIFWSVFDRHSNDNEHRRFSNYSFSETNYSNELSDTAENILTDLFHNTLRSAESNRYDSVEQILRKMDELVAEIYPRKESIINLIPSLASFFVGREYEIATMEKNLNEDHRVFLLGIGGIGKSEIAKQYVNQHKNDYRSIIYLTYSVNLVSTINSAFFISDFEQKEAETDIHYCNRKINKLAELYSGRNLIVIDNLNIEIEDIEDKDIWEKIWNLSCDLIVTTRCTQEAYDRYHIYVNDLKINKLKELYYNYCPYEEEQINYVHDIISAVYSHTLVVELIAKQAKTSMKKPSEMLKKLEDGGILGLEADNVKWNLEKRTVSNHVKGLFTFSNMTEKQKQLVYLMAFMPVDGVDEKIFFDFFEVNNHSDLRYLIDNGWISEKSGKSIYISMHPVIISVVMDEVLSDIALANKLIFRLLNTMILFSDDESTKQYDGYVICRSIAIQLCMWKFKSETAADYLSQYVKLFAKYGHFEERKKYICNAIDIYDDIFEGDRYVAVREYAYNSYANLINDGNNMDEVNTLCKEHLKKAKKNKDLFMQGLWYMTLFELSQVRNNSDSHISFMYVIYGFKLFFLSMKMLKESKKKKNFLTKEKLEKLNYCYMCNFSFDEMLLVNSASCLEHLTENNVFYAKGDWTEKTNLNNAYRIRCRCGNLKNINILDNMIAVAIDMAKLDILDRNYKEASRKLQVALDYYDDKNTSIDINILDVKTMIATISLTIGEYEKAISEYLECLKIANLLDFKNNYDIRVGLARAYIHNGNIREALNFNYGLYQDLKEVDKDKRETYFAEMYYNEAYMFKREGNYEDAIRFFEHAVNQFNVCSVYGNRRDVGIARSKYQLGRIKIKYDVDEALKLAKQAYKIFKNCLGNEHKETIMCKELLNECKQTLK